MSRYYKPEENEQTYDAPRSDEHGHDERDGHAEDEAVAVEGRQTSWWGGGVAAQINSVVGLLLLTVEGVLGLRFVLVAFGANENAGFVDFILTITGPLIEPFENAFANRDWDQGVIEVNTLLAMFAYLLAGILVMLLVNALVPRMREDRGEVVRRRHAHES